MSVERFPVVGPSEDEQRAMDLAEISGYEATDVALARRFAEEHHDEVRHVGAWGWMVWNGARWLRDEGGHVVHLLKETLREMLLERLHKEKAARQVLATMRGTRIRDILQLARSEPMLAVRPEIFNGDPMLFNVANGTIDLRTGKLRPHDRADFINKMVPVDYDPDARCPTFEAFRHRIFDGNARLIAYVQRYVGYALTGSVREHVLVIFYGAGANGKTTLILAILFILGDHAIQAASDLLLRGRDDKHPTSIADLAGVRLAAAVEVDEGRYLAESLVKHLTGGDRIRARRLYQDGFEFSPTHKLVLACNHKPVVRGTDHAIWRRIHLVPFNVTIPEPEQDKDLVEKLKAEAPGILRWAVEGCLEWQRNGLKPPPEVIAATQEYRQQQDVLAAFLETECLTGDGYSVGKGPLGKAYREWCERNGDRPLGRAELRLRLLERGVGEDRDKHARFWSGIGLVNDRTGDGDAR